MWQVCTFIWELAWVMPTRTSGAMVDLQSCDALEAPAKQPWFSYSLSKRREALVDSSHALLHVDLPEFVAILL